MKKNLVLVCVARACACDEDVMIITKIMIYKENIIWKRAIYASTVYLS